jgi:hypothetical protein
MRHIKQFRTWSDKGISESIDPIMWSGGRVDSMPIIGKAITKPIGPFEAGEYDIVEIIQDPRGRDIYIANRWYKPGVPQLIHSELVQEFIPVESGKIHESSLNEAWPDDLYTGTYSIEMYRSRLKDYVEKEHERTGIPRHYLLDGMEDQINSYASEEIPDWFEANFDTIIEDIEDEWNELDDEEKEALETQEKLKKRVI